MSALFHWGGGLIHFELATIECDFQAQRISYNRPANLRAIDVGSEQKTLANF